MGGKPLASQGDPRDCWDLPELVPESRVSWCSWGGTLGLWGVPPHISAPPEELFHPLPSTHVQLLGLNASSEPAPPPKLCLLHSKLNHFVEVRARQHGEKFLRQRRTMAELGTHLHFVPRATCTPSTPHATPFSSMFYNGEKLQCITEQ